MLFKLSKIIHTTRFLTNRRLIHSKKQFLVYTGIPKLYDVQSRLYCDCKKDFEKKKEVKHDPCQDICQARKEPVLASCKPKPITPCVPCPPTPTLDPCDPHVKRQDVVDASNIACPWEDVDKRWSEKLKKYKILAALLAAAALGYFFYSQWQQKEQKKPPKKARYFLRPQRDCRCPTYGKDFPKHAPYVLIGGGTASFAAFRAIKSSDPKAKVLVINTECNYPYMRPPLSKEMWFGDLALSARKLIFKQWNGQERSLFYEPYDFYVPVPELANKPNGGVAVARGWTVKRIDVVNRKVYLDDDTEIEYDKCLIATGSKPKNLPIFETAAAQIKSKISLFREVFDYQELTEIVKDANAVAIIGGGFLGSELACALGRVAKAGKKRLRTKVYQIYREKGNMAHILPEYLSQWATERVKREGVQIINNSNCEDVSANERCELLLHLDTGRTITVDHVIVAVGVTPNTQLAIPSDLEVDPDLDGYLVNTEMEARSNLYVAGDCSCFYDTKLGRRRVEHHDHAVVSGRLAGENMTGAAKPYLHQSMFWSDLGPDLGYEAIGVVDSSLPTVGVFAKNDQSSGDAKPLKGDKHQHDSPNNDFNRGVIFYLREDTVVGIVLWNIFNRMSIARQVLKDQRKYEDLNEVAKLFNIHECDEDVAANAAE